MKGPGPKALKNIKLQIKKSIPLKVSNNLLNVNLRALIGVTLYAARNDKGRAITVANIVPSTAITIVSSIAHQTLPCINASLSLISVKKSFKLDISGTTLSLEKVKPNASKKLYGSNGLEKSNQKYFHPIL